MDACEFCKFDYEDACDFCEIPHGKDGKIFDFSLQFQYIKKQ